MAENKWPTKYWPDEVSHDVSDYDRPLFDILDESARDYPDLTFTIFSGGTKTFAEVKKHRGPDCKLSGIQRHQKRGPGGNFSAQYPPTTRPFFSVS